MKKHEFIIAFIVIAVIVLLFASIGKLNDEKHDLELENGALKRVCTTLSREHQIIFGDLQDILNLLDGMKEQNLCSAKSQLEACSDDLETAWYVADVWRDDYYTLLKHQECHVHTDCHACIMENNWGEMTYSESKLEYNRCLELVKSE